MLRKNVEDFIDQVSKLKVLLIGETIVDKFVKVDYEGYSMKSACPVYKLKGEGEEVQEGGTSAIANHLKNFVSSIETITNTNSEITKTRYIDSFDSKKHVEINQFKTEGFGPINADTTQYDLTIVADFGHGFCDNLNIGEGFHLMCQTNSNNFGFNRVSKWKHLRKKSVCIDLREASLQMNKDIKGEDNEVKALHDYETNAEDLFVTVGARGAVYTNGNEVLRHPAFPSKIVDTIGAGDTFFAFASLLSAINSKDLAVPSLAASLSTTWLCNQESVTPENLLKFAEEASI